MLVWKDHRNSKLVEELEATIRELPNVSVHSQENEVGRRPPRIDAVLVIEADGKATTLIVEAKNTIFPRDARESIWQIRNFARAYSGSDGSPEPVPVLAATSISSGAKEMLRKEGIGYFEEGGSLFLPAKGFYVLLDRPSSKSAVKTERVLFSGRRSQVVHALLMKPNQWFGVNALAKEAFVSSATASQTLTELEKFEWLSSRGTGPHKERMLIEPRGLLEAWVKHLRNSPKFSVRRFYVPSLKPEEILTRIDQLCSARGAAYAITQEWAAQLYSPFLSNISQVRFRLSSDQSAREIADELNAREVQEGSNLGIIESKSYGDFIFRERKRDVWLASPILVYLDLLQGDGRAKEMAEHLRQERIGF